MVGVIVAVSASQMVDHVNRNFGGRRSIAALLLRRSLASGVMAAWVPGRRPASVWARGPTRGRVLDGGVLDEASAA